MDTTKTYRTAYLVPNPRRGKGGQYTMLRCYAQLGDNRSLDACTATAKYLRRRGYTAWVEDASGAHVPVKGAMRAYPGMYTKEEESYGE